MVLFITDVELLPVTLIAMQPGLASQAVMARVQSPLVVVVPASVPVASMDCLKAHPPVAGRLYLTQPASAQKQQAVCMCVFPTQAHMATRVQQRVSCVGCGTCGLRNNVVLL